MTEPSTSGFSADAALRAEPDDAAIEAMAKARDDWFSSHFGDGKTWEEQDDRYRVFQCAAMRSAIRVYSSTRIAELEAQLSQARAKIGGKK